MPLMTGNREGELLGVGEKGKRNIHFQHLPPVAKDHAGGSLKDRTGQKESTRAGETSLANTPFIGGSTGVAPLLPHSGFFSPFLSEISQVSLSTCIQVDLRQNRASGKGEPVPVYCQNPLKKKDEK